MPTRTPHHRGSRLRCIVRIDVHVSKDRAKDASPECMQRSLVPASGAYALSACGRRSPPRRPSDIRCHRRDGVAAEDSRCLLTDRPRSSFRRRPAKSAAFQKTGMSFTATTREGMVVAKGLLPPAFAPALPLTPPTRCPHVGESVVDRALQGHGAVTRGSVTFESTDAF
jgi:hypothetical protein